MSIGPSVDDGKQLISTLPSQFLDVALARFFAEEDTVDAEDAPRTTEEDDVYFLRARSRRNFVRMSRHGLTTFMPAPPPPGKFATRSF